MASQEIELTAFRLIHKFRKVINPANSINVNAKNCAVFMAEYIEKYVVHHGVDVSMWRQIKEEANNL
jgi:hypothetical protein